ncbi:hypothetical protein [Methanobrevibacter sp. DSM 116169]|uniref:hypothetical protein n=1 Tax=Methanobrevibacter sp. DSM 116169 TaxID=3242727 RepID=UPI0038FCAC78
MQTEKKLQEIKKELEEGKKFAIIKNNKTNQLFNAPVMKRMTNNNSHLGKIICPYCGEVHKHGYDEGFRVPHCFGLSNYYLLDTESLAKYDISFEKGEISNNAKTLVIVDYEDYDKIARINKNEYC